MPFVFLGRRFVKLKRDDDIPHPVWDPPTREPVEPPPRTMPKYVHTETLTRRQMIAEMGGWKKFESMTDGEIRSEYLKMIEDEYVL
jgi:hypothetical protein